MASETATCLWCGIRRQARRAYGYVCSGCARMTRIQPRPDDALPPGQWVRTGTVWHFQPDPPSPEPSFCGTQRGYDRHKRRGQDACGDCLHAHRQYRAMQRQRYREAA